jgi:outer membrane protein assembly factor BamD
MKYILLIVAIFSFSCSKIQIIKDDSYHYDEGLRLTQKNLYEEAIDNFSEVGEGDLYLKAKIMEVYACYKAKFYNEAITQIETIKGLGGKIASEDRLYLNYLEGMIYYRQLTGYKASQDNAKLAFDSFKKIIDDKSQNKWQDDARQKLEITKDKISKNYIYIGKYYMNTENFIPAINTFNEAVNNIYSDNRRAEALYRLAEIYYHLGVVRKTKKLVNIINLEYNKDNKWRKYGEKLTGLIPNSILFK